MKFRAIAVVTIGPGAVLGLSVGQAGARQHSLDQVAGRDGWYVTHRHVQFKVGEEFAYEGELPKAMAHAVQSPDAEPVKQARARAKRR